MDHCKLPGGVEVAHEVVVNNTIQGEGPADLQPPGPKSSNLQDFFLWDKKVRMMKVVKGQWLKRMMHLQQLQGRLRMKSNQKYKTLLPLSFYDNAGVLHNPLLWWKQKQFQFPILACL